ncbi:unnamed protein product [Coffea canephora]|uniref:Uncharacterized protein n=1 Tax=Coffea canephora TaxID=49390 RepID=A0A068UA29_COFCA|nr:unnamed protein product [Coffea canephora]
METTSSPAVVRITWKVASPFHCNRTFFHGLVERKTRPEKTTVSKVKAEKTMPQQIYMHQCC